MRERRRREKVRARERSPWRERVCAGRESMHREREYA